MTSTRADASSRGDGARVQLHGLTPLRGVFAIFVIIVHCDTFIGFHSLLDIHKSHVIEKGYLAVDYFFVLSGFIMCHVYAKSFDGGVGRAAFKRFLLARFARVYPLHLFTLLWTLAIYGALRVSGNYHEDGFMKLIHNLWAIPTNLLLLQGMHLHSWPSWNGPSWSVSAEWWVYVLFPPLIAALLKVGRTGKVLLFLAGWAGLWLIVLYIKPHTHMPPPFPAITEYVLDVTADYGFLRCVFGFVMGIAIYDLYQSRWMYRLLSNSYFFVGTMLAMILCMHFGVYDPITVLAFPLLILASAHNTTGVNAVFRHRSLQYLGDISYSIYLTHVPIFATAIALYETWWTPTYEFSAAMTWGICAVWIATTLGVATLTYRYVEVPARRWINQRGKTAPTSMPG